MMYKTGIVVAAAGIAGVSAQGMMGGASISSSCQSTFANILTGPAGTCLGVTDLANVMMTPTNASLVPPINNYLTNTCAQPACTNGTIDAVVANITSGCSSDLSRWDVSDDQVQTVGGYVKEFYPVGREVACLKDSNNSDKFCITAALESLQANLGFPLSVENLQNMSYSTFSPDSSLTKNLTCTDCTVAAWNIIKPYLSSQTQTGVETRVNEICGSGFASGSSPTSIQRTANTAIQASSTSEGSGAARSVVGSLVAVVMGAAGAAVIAL